MDQGPLVTELIEAGAKLARDFDKRIPLQAVYWMKKVDDGEWYLYLVSDQINSSNFGDAYDVVISLLRFDESTVFDSFQVKVRGVDDPIAKDVLEFQQKYPSQQPERLRTRMLGNAFVREAYIYPLSVTVHA